MEPSREDTQRAVGNMGVECGREIRGRDNKPEWVVILIYIPDHFSCHLFAGHLNK